MGRYADQDKKEFATNNIANVTWSRPLDKHQLLTYL